MKQTANTSREELNLKKEEITEKTKRITQKRNGKTIKLMLLLSRIISQTLAKLM